MTLSCYDDTAVWESINDHEERIKNLETLCTNLNSEIVTLKATIDAIEAGDCVIDVVPLMENGVEVGYAITFAEKGTINIYHGRDGSDGAAGSDGKDGADGKDGITPSVGVSKDTDGKYYWTVNGEWLLDEEGNKIPTTGEDGADGTDSTPGADGVTPQLKVEDGVWYVSYDNGVSWVKIGVSAGTSDSGSIFSEVTYDDEYVYFTLSDGTVLTVARGSGFDIIFPDGEEFAFSYGESFDVAYKVIGGTSNTVVKAFASYGWRVKVIKTDDESGFIKVTAPWEMEDGEVVVLLSDGKGNTLIRTLSFVGGELYILSSSFEVGAEASTVEVPLSTNLEYEVVSDVDWITVVPSTKVEMRDETVVLQVAENTSHLSRSAVLSIINPAGLIITQFAVFQHAHSVDAWYLVGDFNQWNSGEESYRLDKEDEWFVLRDFVTTGGGLKFNVGSWEIERTGVFAGANTAMYVYDGGDNIIVPAGTYDVYMDHDAVIVYFMTPGYLPGEVPEVEEPVGPEKSEWGIVGDVNGWSAPDSTMYKTDTDGLFVRYEIEMPEGGFKIRATEMWNDAANYGLSTSGIVEVDHVYDLVCGGGSGNIILAAGTYDIWFDLYSSKVYIMTPGKPISEAVAGGVETPDPSEQTWHIVGNFNGWNPADDAYIMTKEGDYYTFMNFTAEPGCEVKFAPGAWGGDKGGDGSFEINTACPAGNSNIEVPAGTYDIYLNKDLTAYWFMTPGLKPGETPAGDFATLVWDAAVPFGNGQDRNMTMDSEYIYVAQAAGGNGAIKAISIENPNIVKDVKVTTYTPAGLDNGTHAVSCVRMLPNTDPAVNGGKDVLVASNLTTGDGTEKLIFYVWSNGIDADPDYFVIDSGIRRLGDKFTVKGTYQSGELHFFDFNDGNTVIRVNMKDGVAGLWGTPELAYATGRFTMPLSGAYSIGECTIHPDATFDGDGNPTAALLTTNAVNGFFTQKEGNAYELAAWGTDPELTHTYGYNFFEHNGKDYIAYVKVAGDRNSAALNVIEDINGAADFKGTLEAQTGLFTAPVNGTGNAGHGLGDCATAVVDGVRYIAVMGQNIGISLYKLN